MAIASMACCSSCPAKKQPHHSLTAMAAQTDEVVALKRRIEELERAVAEHESGAVVEPQPRGEQRHSKAHTNP